MSKKRKAKAKPITIEEAYHMANKMKKPIVLIGSKENKKEKVGKIEIWENEYLEKGTAYLVNGDKIIEPENFFLEHKPPKLPKFFWTLDKDNLPVKIVNACA